MKKQQIVIQNPNGLHARPASQFMQQASKFKSDIRIENEGKIVNAKSILSLLSGAIKYNSTITLVTEGEDEDQAIAVLTEFLENSRD